MALARLTAKVGKYLYERHCIKVDSEVYCTVCGALIADTSRHGWLVVRVVQHFRTRHNKLYQLARVKVVREYMRKRMQELGVKLYVPNTESGE